MASPDAGHAPTPPAPNDVRDVERDGPTRTSARWRRLTAGVLALVMAAGTTVIAQTPTRAADGAAAAAPGTLNDAKSHMDKGQELFLTKDFAGAAVEFHAAFTIKPFSTFLFNEAVCREKLKQYDDAIKLFEQYLTIDPQAPDRPKTQARIDRIKAARDSAVVAATTDGGVPATADAGPAPIETATASSIDEMRSIVVVESDPDGAPVELWQKSDAAAPGFAMGKPNPGWVKVVDGTTNLQTSLPLGTYHVVIPKFKDFRATDTDIIVAAATISQFRANLSQGSFFGVLKVRAYSEGVELRGAHVFIKNDDDAAAKYADRGTTPYEESLESGHYSVRVEQPGFVSTEQKYEVVHGSIDERKMELARTEEGVIRFEMTGTEVAEVSVDGKKVGIWTPGAKVEIAVKAGEHKVLVTADDRKDFEGDVDVSKGRLTVLHAEMKPSVPRASAWTAGIFSVVFIGGGIYSGLESNHIKSQLNDARAGHRLDQNDPRIQQGQYYAIAADGSFAIGGLLALISAYNFVKDPLPPSVARADAPRDMDALPPAPRPSARLVPMTSPTFAGLALVGEF